ncbi:MAG: FAD:protein FMN transferase [Verrucomicrobiia bacterium]
MSDPIIHVCNHHAMATQFQVRLAGAERDYAAQAAQAAFALADELESHLSRFRANSDVAQIAQLAPGETMRLSEPVFACLEIARTMELATRGAFSITAAARKTLPAPPQWSLRRAQFSIRCDGGKLEFDLGAIGKGFALDRMAEVLREWDCSAFLLVAGGSSILAGEPPPGTAGWSCGLGDDHSPYRFWLKNGSLSGSGLAVKGPHIVDPRTGDPAARKNRAWAWCSTAAESDALSTAAMVLGEAAVASVILSLNNSIVWLHDGREWKRFGDQKGLDAAPPRLNDAPDNPGPTQLSAPNHKFPDCTT